MKQAIPAEPEEVASREKSWDKGAGGAGEKELRILQTWFGLSRASREYPARLLFTVAD